MIPEAELVRTNEGLAPKGEGWFVMNAREGRWRHRPGRGHSLPLTGWTDEECETLFPQLGIALLVLSPGEPVGMYHWEADAEGFLVLSGEALLLIEGEERPLKQWDFVHCPPHTDHMILGAGTGRCALLAVGSREYMATPEWGGYRVADVALRHDAGVQQETTDAAEAYARYPESVPARYQDGWLPVEGAVDNKRD